MPESLEVPPPPSEFIQAFDWVESIVKLCRSLLCSSLEDAEAVYGLVRNRTQYDPGWAPRLTEYVTAKGIPYDKARQSFLAMVNCYDFSDRLDGHVQQMLTPNSVSEEDLYSDPNEEEFHSDPNEESEQESARRAILAGLTAATNLLNFFPARLMCCGVDTADLRRRSGWYPSRSAEDDNPRDAPADAPTFCENAVVWWHGGTSYSRDGDPKNSRAVSQSDHRLFQAFLKEPGARSSSELEFVVSGSSTAIRRMKLKHRGFFASAVRKLPDRGGTLILVKDARTRTELAT